jgi:hypothetical protein
MKPCPEQSEGTLRIATGYALVTTSSDRRAPWGQNDNFFAVPNLNDFVLSVINHSEQEGDL